MTNYQSFPPNQPGGGQPPPQGSQPEPVRYDLAGNPLPPADRGIDAPFTQTDASNPALYPPVLTGYPPIAEPGRPPTGTYPGYGTQLPNMSGDQPYGAPPPGYAGQMGGYPDTARRNQTVLMVGLGVVAMAILIAIGVMKTSKPALVAPPASYTLYVSPDKTFTCQGPKNWTYHDFGVEGGAIGGMSFEKGEAKLQINSSFEASLMGDIMKPPPQPDDSNLPPPPPAIEKLHAFYLPRVKKNYKEYHEGQAVPFTSPGYGDARFSEFTARRGPFGATLKGLRVTLLGTERGVEIVGECPESSWKTLRESYWQVVMSVTQGVPDNASPGPQPSPPGGDTSAATPAPPGGDTSAAMPAPPGGDTSAATPAPQGGDTPANPQGSQNNSGAAPQSDNANPAGAPGNGAASSGQQPT